MLEKIFAVIGFLTVCGLAAAFFTGAIIGTHRRFWKRLENTAVRIEKTVIVAFQIGYDIAFRSWRAKSTRRHGSRGRS